MPMKCPMCGALALVERKGTYTFRPPSNVPGGVFVIEDVSWEECSSCGEHLLGNELMKAIEQEQRVRLGLLSSSEIKIIRQRLGLTQEKMAAFLGVGAKTYTRWEAGRSLQNRSSDTLIRMAAKRPEVFEQLDVQRSPNRREAVSEYLRSLGSQKGKNELSMAAYQGDLADWDGAKLREILMGKANSSGDKDDE